MAVLFGAYICWAIGMIIYSRATAEKRKEQEEREKAREAAERPFREKAFFDGCVQADILLVGQMNDWLSNTAKTAIEIAKKCRLIPANSDRTEQNLHMLRDVFYAQSETEEGKQAIMEKHRENDKAEWEKWSSCSDLPPEAKLQTMLHNWEQELLGMPSPQLIRPAKTSDGMVQAGMAAGIGGAIPALVSLSHTAERNVLPVEPALEAALTGNVTSQRQKKCPVCGKLYLPTTSQAYCSDACRIWARRDADKKRKRRIRQHKG